MICVNVEYRATFHWPPVLSCLGTGLFNRCTKIYHLNRLETECAPFVTGLEQDNNSFPNAWKASLIFLVIGICVMSLTIFASLLGMTSIPALATHKNDSQTLLCLTLSIGERLLKESFFCVHTIGIITVDIPPSDKDLKYPKLIDRRPIINSLLPLIDHDPINKLLPDIFVQVAAREAFVARVYSQFLARYKQ